MTGCAGHPSSSNGSSAPPSSSYTFLTGNWEFVATPAQPSAVPFTTLSGFINESANEPGVNDFATAALQVQSTTCYEAFPDVPLQGVVLGTSVSLTSFSVQDQVISITGARNASSPQITGVYTITGGCGDGDTGTIYGNLYAQVQGTYAGTLPAAGSPKTVTLTLSQSSQGIGDGRSLVGGSAVFGNFACFRSGQIVSPGGYVLGRSLQLQFMTDEPGGSTLTMIGTFDQAARMLTFTSVTVVGGACDGSYGGVTVVS